MKINPINTTKNILSNQTNQKQVTFKSNNDYDTFEKSNSDITVNKKKDTNFMENIDNYIKIRDEFGKKLEHAVHKEELTAWNFYTNSTHDNMHLYSEAQEELQTLYKDKDLYEQLKAIKETGMNNKHLDKQIKILVRAFYDEIESGEEMKALRDKENEISNKYNSYIMTLDGKKISKAEISKILETETDPIIRQKAYEANVKAGDVIADDLVELVKMRNEFAKTKGYDTYFDYMIEEIYDIKPDELNQLLYGVYSKVGTECGKYYHKRQEELSKIYGVDIKDLKDFHYGLLPENSPEGAVNTYLKTKEQIVDIAKQVYSQMGYDVDNMNITLDLFPRENKNTHGFAFCIKPGEDARILANLTNNATSLDTILHELGHCVYDIGINNKLPFVEQDCSSPVMTEAIAMMMGDLPKSEAILKDTVPPEKLKPFMEELKEDDAKFVTRSMQIINFEREMYKNPDQDLKKLWKNMKQKYLYRNNNSEEDNQWATIPHFLTHPGYYQNYFRAALLKAQIYNAMKNELGDISQNPKTSEYLNEKLFKYGSSVPEEDLILEITGKPLSEDDFCNRIMS